jgi:uncharacterized protein
MTLSRRLALAGLAGLPAACSSPNPNLFVLATVAGPTHAGSPRTISVRPVSLARYLERSQIVRSTEGYRVDVLPNDWWGEPLDAMILRVLVEELTQRLPGSSIYSDNGAISVTPDVALEINIQRLDMDSEGSVRLSAQVATDARSGRTRTVAVSIRPRDGTTRALVEAMSICIGQLADGIASMLVSG